MFTSVSNEPQAPIVMNLTETLSTQILHGLRDMSGVEQWNAQMAQLPQNIGSRLRQVYHV